MLLLKEIIDSFKDMCRYWNTKYSFAFFKQIQEVLITLEFGRCFWHFLISCVKSSLFAFCHLYAAVLCVPCKKLQSRFFSEKVSYTWMLSQLSSMLCLTHVLKLDVSYIDSESIEILHSCCLKHGCFTGDLQWGLVYTGSGEERLLASSCGILQ